MKQGKTLVELAQQITSENAAKRDFVASTEKLSFTPELRDGTESALGAIRFQSNGDEHIVAPTKHCIRQIGTHCGIPAQYVERMIEHGHTDLLAQNINHWFKKEPSNRMLRTLINGTGIARAFVSDRYRPLDNADLAEIVLPELQKSGCAVLSSEITETRMYIQAATPRMELDLNKLRESGKKLSEIDPVQAGLVISNSEVGAGSLRVEPMLYRLSCFNGMISAQSIRRYHVGRRMAENVFAELEGAAQYFTDATREADDTAFWMKVRDVVRGVFNTEKFESLCAKFAATGSIRLECGAMKAVEEVTTRFKLTEGESESVLNHLVEGGDLSAFGLVNAVTRASTDVESYDRAIELERMGGDIIELPPTMWKKLATEKS